MLQTQKSTKYAETLYQKKLEVAKNELLNQKDFFEKRENNLRQAIQKKLHYYHLE